MTRFSTSGLAIAVAMAAASPAAAGSSWSFGFGIAGPPVYYGPPPVYYEPPVVYEPGPPVLYEEPVIVAPPVRVRERSPDEIFDWLEAAGYREFGPMAHRDPLYKLNAVNPEGDLVALEIHAYTGAIERELILQARHAAPLPVSPPPVVETYAAPAAAPPAAEPYAAPRPYTPPTFSEEKDDEDPLVVY